MTPDKFPITWTRNGQPVTLPLGLCTPNVRKAFCQWLKPRYLAEAWENTQSPYLDEDLKKRMMVEYQAARQEVNSGGIFWSETACLAVAIARMTDAGNTFLNRLLFGDSVKDWTDEELLAMIRAKLKDEASDYYHAIDIVMEEADPKVIAPGSGLLPVPTGTSVTSPV